MSTNNNNENLVKRHITSSKTTEEVLNPIVKDSKCKLINNKCSESYYCHTYDPSSYVKILCEEPFNLNPDVISRFDCCKKEKCCNVVSISLYLKEDCNIKTNIDTINNKYLIKTLPNIYTTILNVKLNLPKWIVRLYLDKSVYNCIENLCKITKDKNKCDEICKIKEIYENILKSDNVEIYTYLCEDINIDKTRTYRFLTMIDPDVNLYVIREADGIVSNLDCHNISVYEHNDKFLFYLPDIGNVEFWKFSRNMQTYQYQSYSPWLNAYKYLLEHVFFNNNNNIYDLLAGTFSCKLRLNSKKYYNKINELNNKINFILQKTDDEFKIYINELIKIYGEINYPGALRFIGGSENQYEIFISRMNQWKDKFNIGFDEIFLLDIFKEIISVEYNFKDKEEDVGPSKKFRGNIIEAREKNKFNEIKKFVLSKPLTTDNKIILDYNNSSSFEILKEIVDEKYIIKCNEDKSKDKIKENENFFLYLIDLIFQNKNINDDYKKKPLYIHYNNKNNNNNNKEVLSLINEEFKLGTTDNIMNHYLEETIKSINSLTNKNQGGRRIKNKRKSTNKLKKNKKKLTRKSKINQKNKSKK
jgi:hypothetical protein